MAPLAACTHHVAEAVDEVGFDRGIQRLDVRPGVGRVDAHLTQPTKEHAVEKKRKHATCPYEPSQAWKHACGGNILKAHDTVCKAFLTWSMMTMLCPLHRQSEYLRGETKT